MAKTQQIKTHFNEIASLRDRLRAAQPESKIDLIGRARQDRAEKMLAARVATQTPFFISRAYMEAQKQTAKAFNQALLADEDVIHKIKAWPTFTRDDKKHLLQRCAGVLANLQSECGIIIDDGLVDWFRYDEKNQLLGHATIHLVPERPGPDTIFLNEEALSEEFDKALSTLAHEQTHIFQGELARAYRKGTLPADHPFTGEARFFAYWFDSENTIPASECHEAYANQAGEVDARAVQKALREEREKTKKEWAGAFQTKMTLPAA